MEHPSPQFFDPVIRITDPGFTIFAMANWSITPVEISSQPFRTLILMRV
jgi:hypothetical protein